MEAKDTDENIARSGIDFTVPLKPFADPVFEAVFANKDVAGIAARSFINAILAESGDPLIGEITQLTPQKSMSNILGRGYRFDIEARVENRELADIEVQLRYMDMNNRGLLYGSKFLDENAERGAKMEAVLETMPRVIIINLLYFDLRKGYPDFHQPVELMYRKPKDTGEYERASDRMIIHNIELKKFMKHKLPDLKNNPYSKETPALYFWLWALCVSHEENKPLGEVIRMDPVLAEFAEKDEGFKQYAERYEEISTDLNVRRMYAIWTEGMSALDQARTEGIAEGKEEERIEIARSLIELGSSTEIIILATKLPVEKIEELREEYNASEA